MKNLNISLLVASLLFATSVMAGCGPGAPPAVVQATQVQIDNAVKMREVYVKANGNYDSLSAEDKDAYLKLAGGEAAGQVQWKTMAKNPVGGANAFSAGDPRANMAGAPGAGQ